MGMPLDAHQKLSVRECHHRRAHVARAEHGDTGPATLVAVPAALGGIHAVPQSRAGSRGGEVLGAVQPEARGAAGQGDASETTVQVSILYH